jgi:hypothetical protein
MPRLGLSASCFAALAALAGTTAAFAQTPPGSGASATATASTEIIDPIGILAASGGSSAADPARRAAGMAQLSGGGFAIQGPANEVVSVSVTLPANVQRAGGGAPLPVTASRLTASRILTDGGSTAFKVAGGVPVQSAAGGLYSGVAMVLVNLN